MSSQHLKFSGVGHRAFIGVHQGLLVAETLMKQSQRFSVIERISSMSAKTMKRLWHFTKRLSALTLIIISQFKEKEMHSNT